MTPARQPFGRTSDGRPVDRLLIGSGRLRLGVITLGAAVQSLQLVPDDGGPPVDVVLGLDDAAAYESQAHFLGATVGRFANRIAQGRFVLDGEAHQVPTNDRGHALHGGPDGFHRQLWDAEPDAGRVVLRHTDPDGHMGFPGRLEVTVTYAVDGDTVRVEHRVTTDRPTVVNLTNHTYFDLSAGGGADHHVLQVAASRHVPVDPTGIPTGAAQEVTGTPYDLRAPTSLQHLELDDCLLLDEPGSDGPAARLVHPRSGRVLELHTDRPAVQVYTGDKLDGLDGKGRSLGPRAGLCLEAQLPPDAPNRDDPRAVLRPGGQVCSVTTWRLRG